MLLDELSTNTHFSIFGAQVIAYGAYRAIKELLGIVPDAFVVSDLSGNPAEIENIPVITVDKLQRDGFIVVGVTELVQKEVIPMLSNAGYNNIFALTQHEEYLLMSRYFDTVGGFERAKTLYPCDATSSYEMVTSAKEESENNALDSFKQNKVTVNDMNHDIALFEVRNHRDKKLETTVICHDYEYTIQAGTDITDERIADIFDNTGENISARNKQYCEMTGSYWVWKNAYYDWIGIEHYRRHMLIEGVILDENVDVLIPYPYICYPNTMSQFRRFVSDGVYELLLLALKAVHPDEYKEYEKIMFGQFQYTYNMVFARKEVFADYCKWFFEITFYMENNCDNVPDIKSTRALSYVAEVLTNLYFMYNKSNLKIKHVEREIYI